MAPGAWTASGGERSHGHAGPTEPGPHGPRQVDGPRGVAVDAHRAGRHRHRGAVHGDDRALRRKADGPPGDDLGVGDERAGARAGYEPTVRPVGAVGEGLRDGDEAGGLGLGVQRGPRLAQDRQGRVVGRHGIHDRPSLGRVDGRRGVERPMRLQVRDAGCGHPAHRFERTELVEDVGGEVARVHVDAATAEAREVAVPDLRTDDHSTLCGSGDGAADGARVTGVEAARDVGARDHAEHGLVVAEHPGAERLAEVGVEVDRGGHARTLALGQARRGPQRAEHDRRPEVRTAVVGVPRRAEAERQPMTVMFAACGPFAPCWVSYSTLAFSSSER